MSFNPPRRVEKTNESSTTNDGGMEIYTDINVLDSHSDELNMDAQKDYVDEVPPRCGKRHCFLCPRLDS